MAWHAGSVTLVARPIGVFRFRMDPSGGVPRTLRIGGQPRSFEPFEFMAAAELIIHKGRHRIRFHPRQNQMFQRRRNSVVAPAMALLRDAVESQVPPDAATACWTARSSLAASME